MQFEYDGQKYELVLEKLTLGEAAKIKQATGLSLAPALVAAGEMDPEVLGALILVSIQRKRPEVTADDIGDISLAGLLGGEDDEGDGQSPPADTGDQASPTA